MTQTCDLHTHSVFSDGTYTPAQIIDEAVSLGLSAVALCDHNTVDGLPDFIQASKGKNIEAICGAEFSVDYNGKELHLLGLFIEEKHFEKITEMMDAFIARKEQSNRDLVDALDKAGYHLDYEKIKATSPTGKINRAHIATALTEAGYTESIKAAFKELLSPEKGYYVEPKRITVWEMLTFLQSINAVPVLAHPFLSLSEAELREFLPKAKSRGLIGMEIAYSTYDDATSALAASIAHEFGLLPSGGSDFHGAKKPDIKLGTGKGNLFVPREWTQKLRSTNSSKDLTHLNFIFNCIAWGNFLLFQLTNLRFLGLWTVWNLSGFAFALLVGPFCTLFSLVCVLISVSDKLIHKPKRWKCILQNLLCALITGFLVFGCFYIRGFALWA